MIEDDRARFAKALNGLAATFRVTLDEGAFDGYWIALEDLPVEAVEAGIREALLCSRFMPPPSEIRAAAGVPGVDQMAAEAWETIVSAPKTGEKLVFQDGVTARCIEILGGWASLTNLDDQGFNVWARKEFLRLYPLLSKAGAHHPRRVAGWLDLGEARIAAPYLGPLASDDVPKLSGSDRAQRIIEATADFMRKKGLGE